MTLKVAIVGCGKIADGHIEEIQKMPGGRPIVDGWYVTEDLSATYAKARQTDVDVLVGSNKDEGAFPFFGVPKGTASEFVAQIKDRFGDRADDEGALARERAGDIARLARAFLARYAEEEGRVFAGFTPEAEAAIEEFGWPGNVRQLQNVIRRVVVLHNSEYVSAEMLPFSPDGSAPEAARDTGLLPRTDSPAIAPYRMQEQKIIEKALAAFGGNAQKAAAALEIAPSTIYRKLQGWAQGREVG